MSEEIVPSPARGRRRLFQPRQSGNPAGRRRGSRNKAALTAATSLDGEAMELTRRAVEAALAGDMLGMKLCLGRVLPRCHERPVKFSLPSLAAIGDDVEDADEDIGDAEAIDDCDPLTGAGRRRPARQFVEGSLFNLEEKFSCRFSADAGGGIAPCNSWLKLEKRRRDRQRHRGNRPTAEERLFEDGSLASVVRHDIGLARPQMPPWPAATAPRDPPAGRRPRPRGSAPQMNQLEQFKFQRTVARRGFVD
jgi:hypothetical protein